MLASAPFCSRQHVVIPSKNPINYKYDYKVGLQRVRPVAAVPGRKRPAMDATDAQQEVDIERLINCVQELQDKCE